MSVSSRFHVTQKGILKRKKHYFFDNVISKKCFQLIDTNSNEVKQTFNWDKVKKIQADKEVVFDLGIGRKKVVIGYKEFPSELITEVLRYVKKIKSPINEKVPQVYKCTQITKRRISLDIKLELKYGFYDRLPRSKASKIKQKFIRHYYKDIVEINIFEKDPNALLIGLEGDQMNQRQKSFPLRHHLFIFENMELKKHAYKVISQLCNILFNKQIIPKKFESIEKFNFFEENIPEPKKREELLNAFSSIKVDKFYCHDLYFRMVKEDFKPLKLVFNENYIYEIDIEEKFIKSRHRYNDIFKIVRYKEQFLILEYKSQHPYIYKFLESKFRDETITTILELSKRKDHILLVCSTPTNPKSKVDGRSTPDVDTEELFLKSLMSLDTGDTSGNIPLGKWKESLFRCAENMAVRRMPLGVKVNKKYVGKVINILEMLNSKFMSDTNTNYNETTNTYSINNKLLSECICECLRIIISFVTIKEYYNTIIFDDSIVDTIAPFLQVDNNPLLCFYAFSILRYSVDRIFPYKSENKEKVNKIKFLKDDIIKNLFSSLEKFKEDIKENSLPIYIILDILEVCCYSSISSTPKLIYQKIFSNFKKNIGTFHFQMYFSKSVGIVFNSSVLIKVFFLELQRNRKKYNEYKMGCLKDITFLQHFYLTVSTSDKKQMLCSSDIVGLLSENNKHVRELFKRVFPNDVLLKELVAKRSSHSNEEHFSKNYLRGKRLNLSSLTANLTKQNWRRFCFSIRGSFNSIYLVWNDDARKELSKKLKKEINDFMKARDVHTEQLIWNFDEFKVKYDCLKKEPIVGKYFIKYLDSNQFKSNSGIIMDPSNFMEQLHHELLFNEDDQHLKICLKACTVVYNKYRLKIGEYPFMKNLCLFVNTKIKSDKGVILETLYFLLALFKIEKNISNFIKFNGIEIFIPFIDSIYDDIELNLEGVLIYQSNIDKTSINVKITKLCIDICVTLASFRLCIDKNGNALIPKPISIQKMCTSEIITKLIQLLLIRDEEVFLKIVDLMNFLTSNEDILVRLYETGFFFFIFLYEGKDFYPIIKLISRLHLHQNIRLKECYTGGKKDYSPYIPSALHGLLPRELIYQITAARELGKKKKQNLILEISKVLSSDKYESPLFIWNKQMREEMKDQIKKYLKDFFTEIKKKNNRGTNNEEILKKIISKKPININYSCLDKEFVCYHYYLRNFSDISKWPKDFDDKLKEDKTEMLKLINAIKIIIKKRINEKQNVNYCVKTLLILYQIDENIFLNYHTEIDNIITYVNELMFKQSKLQEKEVVSIFQSLNFLNFIFSKSYQKINFLKILNLALQIIMQVTEIMNVENIETLDKRLQKKLKKQRAKTKSKIKEFDLKGLNIDEKLYEIILLCLKIIFFFTSKFNEIVDHFEESTHYILDIFINLLKLPFQKTIEVKEKTIDLISIFMKSKILQDSMIVDGGLILFLLSYISNETCFSRKAIYIFQKIGGFIKTEQPINVNIKMICKKLFPNRVEFLESNEKEGNANKAKKIWKEKMNNELGLFLQMEIDSLKKLKKKKKYDLNKLLNFEYKHLKGEIKSNGIFLKLFNLYKTDERKKLVSRKFVDGLFELFKNNVDELKRKKINKLIIINQALFHASEFRSASKYFKNIETKEVFLKHIVDCCDTKQLSIFTYSVKLVLNLSLLKIGKNYSKQLIKFGILKKFKDIYLNKSNKRFFVWSKDFITLILYNLLDNLKEDCNEFECFIIFFLKVIFGLKDSQEKFVKRIAILLSKILTLNSQIEEKLLKFLPKTLVILLKRYPIVAIRCIGKEFKFAEFVWNDYTRKKVKKFINSLKSKKESFSKNDSLSFDKLPYNINGVFPQLYIDQKDYPISDFKTFILKLVESLKKKDNLDEKIACLLIAFGEDKYVSIKRISYVKSIEAISLIIDTISKLKGNNKLNGAKILYKLSFNKEILKMIWEVKNFQKIFIKFIKELKEEEKYTTENLLNILLKFIHENRNKIKEIFENEKSDLFKLVWNIVLDKKEEYDMNVRMKGAQVIKIVCSDIEKIEKSIKRNKIYKTLISQTNVTDKTINDIFTGKEPPIFKGELVEYMKIGYNERMAISEIKSLFNKDVFLNFNRTLGTIKLPKQQKQQQKKVQNKFRSNEKISYPQVSDILEKEKEENLLEIEELQKKLEYEHSTIKKSKKNNKERSPYDNSSFDLQDNNDENEKRIKELSKKKKKQLPHQKIIKEEILSDISDISDSSDVEDSDDSDIDLNKGIKYIKKKRKRVSVFNEEKFKLKNNNDDMDDLDFLLTDDEFELSENDEEELDEFEELRLDIKMFEEEEEFNKKSNNVKNKRQKSSNKKSFNKSPQLKNKRKRKPKKNKSKVFEEEEEEEEEEIKKEVLDDDYEDPFAEDGEDLDDIDDYEDPFA